MIFFNRNWKKWVHESRRSGLYLLLLSLIFGGHIQRSLNRFMWWLMVIVALGIAATTLYYCYAR